MKRRSFLVQAARASLGLASAEFLTNGQSIHLAATRSFPNRPPNFVIIVADDMGYGDWSRGGSPTIRTPNLNRLADEGAQLTQFYSGNPVCSPSRSALLTGRNCIRTGVIEVFFPGNGRGMALSEVTLAEALKPLGYNSGCIGKWHLGSTQEFRPLKQGFDYYYGLLYSNDMDNPDLFRNDQRIEHPTDQGTLTKRYTQEAISFIERFKDQPFFLYLPHTMPHVPLHASERFLGKSRRGLYGDVIEELDWSVGEILAALDRLGLARDTFLFFASDNGPWMIKNQEGGTAGPLRGAKGDTWEAGMRVPAIARWPGQIPAGRVSMEVGSFVDLFPTCLKLAGGSLPSDRPMDGVDLTPALEGRALPERAIYFYRGEHLRAVRKGRWKLHFSYYEPSFAPDRSNGKWITPKTPLLFDLEADPSERFDLASQHPDVVSSLKSVAAQYEDEIRHRGENRDLLDWFVHHWPTAPKKGE